MPLQLLPFGSAVDVVAPPKIASAATRPSIVLRNFMCPLPFRFDFPLSHFGPTSHRTQLHAAFVTLDSLDEYLDRMTQAEAAAAAAADERGPERARLAVV